MTYYIEINGKPSCSENFLTMDQDDELIKSGLSGCSHSSPTKAEDAARVIRGLNGDLDVVVREGGCPAYAESLDEQYERSLTPEETRIRYLEEILREAMRDEEILPRVYPRCPQCAGGDGPSCWNHRARKLFGVVQ
jgi:hypothetical protein